MISVSDKTGIVAFAQALNEMGIEILSTGGTFKLLNNEGVPAVEISDYTGFPEMMDGRVKTLHPRVHGGILARRDVDAEVMAEHDIPPIDMVVVNLYPFEADGQARRLRNGTKSSRISISAVQPCCAPRPRTTNSWPWWSIPETTTACWTP